jgi:hypothetical protein
MFRKLVLAIAAVATIGTAGIASTTSADAAWWGPRPYWGPYVGYGMGFYGPVRAYNPCVRWVRTPFGWRRAYICY